MVTTSFTAIVNPQNIGFDAAGKVVVFDFGLSRFHYPDKDRRLTGRTGSARYMAPENIRSQDYSFPADVFSFSILIWEVCTLQTAYASAPSLSRLLEQVAFGKARPSSERIESPILRNLLKLCWHMDAFKRPSFATIVHDIQKIY